MAMLSQRAQRHLNSLERAPTIPVATVRQALLDGGYPVYDCWLEFHDRYAGYTEDMGSDGVIWGMMHAHARFVLGEKGRALNAEAYLDESDGLWYAEAADIHPSYNYVIDERGHFPWLIVSSFDTYIEQGALWNEFIDAGERPRRELHEDKIDKAIRESPDAIKLDALSDKYSEWWQGERIIAQRYVNTEERWAQALIR